MIITILDYIKIKILHYLTLFPILRFQFLNNYLHFRTPLHTYPMCSSLLCDRLFNRFHLTLVLLFQNLHVDIRWVDLLIMHHRTTLNVHIITILSHWLNLAYTLFNLLLKNLQRLLIRYPHLVKHHKLILNLFERFQHTRVNDILVYLTHLPLYLNCIYWSVFLKFLFKRTLQPRWIRMKCTFFKIVFFIRLVHWR